MFEKTIEHFVNKRLDLLETKLQAALTKQVEETISKFFQNTLVELSTKLTEVTTKVDTLATNAFTPEKLVETLKDSTSSLRESFDTIAQDIAETAVSDGTDGFLTSNDFDPSDYDLITKGDFDPSDFDCVTSDNVGDAVSEHVDIDEITNQVIEKIREALGAKS